MHRHDADPTSFVAGVVFLVIGAGYLLTSGHGSGTGWVLPLLLIGLGLAGLAGTVSRARRRQGPGENDEDPFAR